MPVSHLSLNVSHIPSATSFFLSTLQPLGYRYVGQRGDSIALGVHEADFFLTQQSRSSRISPTHIAFSANDRLAVRNCYTAALNAGGRPSGAPGYCNNEGTIFNAAVEDLDGNTIEFIHRESLDPLAREDVIQPSVWQESSRSQQDAYPPPETNHRGRQRSHPTLNFAPNYRRPARTPDPPMPGIRRSKTAPTSPSSEFPSKTVFGTILGAAAGAAMMYAMTSTERKNARDEAAFKAATERAKSRGEIEYRSAKSDRRASANDAGEDRYSSTGRRARSLKLLEYEKATTESNDGQKRSRRKPHQRSKTVDVIEYVPASESQPRRRHKTRSAAMIEDRKHYYIEAAPARSSVSSQQSARRDSVVSSRSHRSRHGHHGSRHSDRRSSTSTIKPSQHRSRDRSLSAAGIPLPASIATRARSQISPAQVPIPESREGEWSDAPDDDSDGLDDMKTVGPDDSISCADFSSKASPPKSGSRHSRRRQLESLRKETQSERIARMGDVAAPARSKYSDMTLPVRTKKRRSDDDREYRRGAMSYA